MYGKRCQSAKGQTRKGSSFRKRRSVPQTSNVVALYRRPSIARPVKAFRPKWASPLDHSTYVKLRYSDHKFDMSTVIGDGYISKNVFNGNDIYDPDYTGVGSQPYGRDEMAALFHAYTVIGSKIKVGLYVIEQCYKGVVTVVPSMDNALNNFNENDLRNSVYAKQRLIDYNAGRKKYNFIKSYMSTRKMFPGVNPRDFDFRAAIGGNPAIRWYWHVYFDTSDVAVETSCYMDVDITYYCILSKIENIPSS